MIDAHQHFWKYTAAEYGWIDDSMGALQRNFLPPDLHAAMTTVGVTGSIAVQARQTLVETAWLLELAAQNEFIRAVVGWAPIAAPSFPRTLETITTHPKLKGLRHVVQAEPDGFLASSHFNAGISALRGTGLVYDILIVERQIPESIEFVDRHPDQLFVLDHIAKPRIADGELNPWAANVTELALRPNVYCKLSGLVTEANWQNWTAASLKLYVDIVLEAFTPQRIMFGSDWPVCTVAASYAGWFETLTELLSSLSIAERERIFGGTAAEVYKLKGF